MNVRTFAFALLLLGLVLVVFGWLTTNPAALVGLTLIALGVILLWTRRQNAE
ncbi:MULTISPECIES: hypothetical protein [Halomonas]|uniref:PEP-CTERM protein-sorting domain-containing protein n=1 Tax=Halomonas flagellata TaxID=2920385 RepID=A0ABS9RX47_9GAMM|nr:MULTISPECIES: hypothetical protein [Halomonas]MCH4564375.1 hypothetical protein [Halomonas flagellata]